MARQSKASRPLRSIAPSREHDDFPAEALLDRVTRALSEMGALEALVKSILAEGRRLLKAREIYLLLREDGQLVLRGALGLERENGHAVHLPEGWGLEGRAVEQGRSVFAYDAGAEPGYLAFPGRRTGVGAMVAVPLRLRNRVIGVVAATRAEAGWFTAREARWLTALAQMAAVAMENERLRASEQQQARLKAREEFLAVVSHELKTPVAVIRAYAEVLHRRASQPTGLGSDVEVLESIIDQADRMLAMIEELLDLHRLEIGQFRLELSRFDLRGFAERTVHGLQLASPSHRVTCRTQDGPLLVLADRKRLEEVLTNLVDNAIKYSPAGTEVRVEVHEVRLDADGQVTENDQATSHALLAVTDYGRGIQPSEQRQIFERFYQASGTPVRGHVGLGLGLYISREIVHRHGGHMWVESTPGEGSRFYVALPLAGQQELD